MAGLRIVRLAVVLYLSSVVGATGRASGAHLDWRMNWRDRRIDPQLLAPPMPKP